VKARTNDPVDGGLRSAAGEEIQPVRDALLTDPIASLAPGADGGRGELYGLRKGLKRVARVSPGGEPGRESWIMWKLLWRVAPDAG
jgi:hypothetical protein